MSDTKCSQCGDPGGECTEYGLEIECLARQRDRLEAIVGKLPAPVMLMAAAMLDLASDRFSNFGCNDMPQDTIDLWTPEMWRDMTAGERDDDDDDYVPQCDWFTMSLCADQLRAAAEANGSET